MFIPAFIFFFQMLYPFAWANDPRRATAAAAGGCMLVRRDALRRAGGMAAIRDALIDDCALAKKLKAHGPIWIGLTERVHSIRAYPAIADIRRMVARTAYAQLALFAAAACRNRCRPGADLSRAGGAGVVRRRLGAVLGIVHLAADGVRVSADAAFLSACRRCGAWRCRRSRRSIWRSRSIPPISMPAGAAACGRAARRPMFRKLR